MRGPMMGSRGALDLKQLEIPHVRTGRRVKRETVVAFDALTQICRRPGTRHVRIEPFAAIQLSVMPIATTVKASWLVDRRLWIESVAHSPPTRPGHLPRLPMFAQTGGRTARDAHAGSKLIGDISVVHRCRGIPQATCSVPSSSHVSSTTPADGSTVLAQRALPTSSRSSRAFNSQRRPGAASVARADDSQWPLADDSFARWHGR
ncbi:hypothetical protein BD626DRAFT_13772 [Schizophyllum amplum]|uniref:Uncharacterized protein n=1 Tax=Schizophyllum amplum TaxID=97359 RepID=A0A550CXL2_9AGAR|nr:hypothetical protein BD626DRAFT_13772 [Auriculariopsis ampla]